MFVLRHADGSFVPHSHHPHPRALWICDAERYWSREVAERAAPVGATVIEASTQQLTAPVPLAEVQRRLGTEV
jgi:hypothetical protein